MHSVCVVAVAQGVVQGVGDGQQLALAVADGGALLALWAGGSGRAGAGRGQAVVINVADIALWVGS